MSQEQDDDAGELGIDWYSPWNYPTRVDNKLAICIAEAIAQGANLTAACAREGITPSRARQWLRWGEEAYRRDANPSDHQADYLNFFLKVLQAYGISAVPAQIQVHHQNPAWWLSHHPEVRGEWGGDASQAIIDTPDQVVEAIPDVHAPRPAPGELREALRTLIIAGAANEKDADLPSVAPLDTTPLYGDNEQDIG